MADRIDRAIEKVEREIEKASAEALSLKEQLTPKEWKDKRGGATKRIYNLMERLNALRWMKAYPQAVYYYDVRVVGLTGQPEFEKPRRVYDAAQLKNNAVQPVEMKAPNVVPKSVRGGLSNHDILANFREKSSIGKQIKTEKWLIGKAKRLGAKIILEGFEVVENTRMRLEIDPKDLEISRIVRYGELPDKHLLSEAEGLVSGTKGVARAEASAAATRALTRSPSLVNRGTDLMDRAVNNPLGTGPPEKGTTRRIVETTRTGARVATARALRLALAGGRIAARIAIGMVIPPFTPGQILFDLVLLYFLILLASREARERKRAIRDALQALDPQLQEAVNRQKEEAVRMQLENWERLGYGFVYMNPDITLHHDIVQQEPAYEDIRISGRVRPIQSPPAERWSATLHRVTFTISKKTEEKPPEGKKSQPNARTQRTSYRSHVSAEEPFLTPFEILSGEVQALVDILEEGRRALVERGDFEPSAPVLFHLSEEAMPASLNLFEYRMSLEECRSLKRLLDSHRLEQIEKADALLAALTRRIILMQATEIMQDIVRYVKGSYKFGTPIAGNAEAIFAEAVDLATLIAQDVKRASQIPERQLVYRLDAMAASILGKRLAD